MSLVAPPSPGSQPGSTADAIEQQAERQAAVRALLHTPVLTVHHRRFPLVRRHATWLREVFIAETGWVLTVDAEVARLHKHPPATLDASRPASDRRGTPFSRRRYVLTCLALAIIERAEAQLTLGWLADQLLAEAADEALGVRFDLGDRGQRGDLVAVVRLLIDLGVISRVAGDEQAFVEESGDALYDLDRRVLGRLLAADRGPSTIHERDARARLASLSHVPVVDAPDARARAARQALGRRLLDDPVVYMADLTEAESDYLRTQRAATLRRLSEMSGLEPEVRAEGMALLDPTGEATDVGLPEDGTDGHVTLLVAEHLAGLRAAASEAGPGDGGTARVTGGPGEESRVGPIVPAADVVAHIARLVGTHGHRWRKAAREPGAERLLAHTALTRLAHLGLVALRDGADGPAVQIRPAVHRFATDDPTVQGTLT